MTRIIDIEGIGEAFAKKLEAVGVTSVEDLLERAATPVGREELCDKTGISDKLILKWANHADLYRIKGIGSEYADLLEAAGVDTVPELAHRKAEHLVKALEETNEKKELVRRTPTLKQVEDWIEQAKTLPRKLTY